MDRALLVGINNYPAPNTLNGCVNDVTDMSNFLAANCNFDVADIRLLVDDRATKDAIMERLQWLIAGCRSGDRLLFHYSGHGAQFPIRDAQGNVNEVHEVICPVDFDWTVDHAIFDTDFQNLFSTVPDGVEFVWLSDSCFSGGLLKAMLKPGSRRRAILPPVDIAWRLRTAIANKIRTKALNEAISTCNVALLSACTATQESEDTEFNNRPNGAFTYFLLKELNTSNGLTEPLTAVTENIIKPLTDYSQTPQLEGSKSIGEEAFLTC